MILVHIGKKDTFPLFFLICVDSQCHKDKTPKFVVIKKEPRLKGRN